jgi:hypothetical protein
MYISRARKVLSNSSSLPPPLLHPPPSSSPPLFILIAHPHHFTLAPSSLALSLALAVCSSLITVCLYPPLFTGNCSQSNKSITPLELDNLFTKWHRTSLIMVCWTIIWIMTLSLKAACIVYWCRHNLACHTGVSTITSTTELDWYRPVDAVHSTKRVTDQILNCKHVIQELLKAGIQESTGPVIVRRPVTAGLLYHHYHLDRLTESSTYTTHHGLSNTQQWFSRPVATYTRIWSIVRDESVVG